MRYLHGCIAAAIILLVSQTVPADAAPRRIVSTNLCTDEYIFRLVPRADIAALSFEAGDRHPVVSTIADRIGGIALIHPSAEAVLMLHPDLVLIYQGTETRLRAQLAALDVPVLELPWANSLADIRKVTRMLGRKLGAPEKAATLLDTMNRKLAEARKRAAHPPVRSLIYEANGYATSGGVTDEIMVLSGLENAAPAYQPTRMGTIPVEAVIAAAPDLLLLNEQRGAAQNRADLILHHPALRAASAHAFVAHAELTPLLCAGPWSADVAAPLAELGRQARKLELSRSAH